MCMHLHAFQRMRSSHQVLGGLPLPSTSCCRAVVYDYNWSITACRMPCKDSPPVYMPGDTSLQPSRCLCPCSIVRGCLAILLGGKNPPRYMTLSAKLCLRRLASWSE